MAHGQWEGDRRRVMEKVHKERERERSTKGKCLGDEGFEKGQK